MKKILLLLAMLIVSCSYHKDKLIIRNNSSENIDYETFIKVKDDNDEFKYKIITASGDFDSSNESSPIVRNYISNEIDSNSMDSILYIYIYNKKDEDYFNKNMDSIIYQKDVIFHKYSKRELDNMDWIVNYK